MVSSGWLSFLSCFVLLNIVTATEGIDNYQLYIELVESKGYPIETHEVETEDGYLLTVYRIPYGRNSNGNVINQYPVLVIHGIIGDAENFIWLNKSIGYLLADNGYDVWVMNSRGAWHSIKHKTLDPHRDDAYWRFTWHEIGIYDIPATMDYILNNTGAHNLSLIAHSQGTTACFVMGSLRPHHNEKVNGMIAMAPVGVVLNPTYFLIVLAARFYNLLVAIVNLLDIQRLPPFLRNRQMHALFQFFCGHEFSPREICKFVITTVTGPGDKQFDTRILPTIAPLAPSSASIYQLEHYGQNIIKEKFLTFDWGSAEENIRHYGSENPVGYNVTNINFKVALYHAPNDIYVTNQTLQFLVTTLPIVSELYIVPYRYWTHVDFLWGSDLDVYIHHNLLRTLNGFIHN